MEKCYFVSYRWRNHKEGILDWNYSNTLLTKHPLLWLRDTKLLKNEYNDEYQIEFYEEIDKDIYDLTYLQLED